MQFPKVKFESNLRDLPENKKDFEIFVADLKSKLKKEDNLECKLELLENLGVASRTLENFVEAERFLLKAVAVTVTNIDKFSYSRLIQNFARLAHVYQWTKEFNKANLLFDQIKSIIAEKEISKGINAAIHQHFGKLLFDQGYFTSALLEFSLAKKIRVESLLPQDQIDSSNFSFNETLAKLNAFIPEGTILRRADAKDAKGIHLAHMKSINEICAKVHTEEEIKAWGGREYREDIRIHAIKNDYVWVVEKNNIIEGFSHLSFSENNKEQVGYIAALYLTSNVSNNKLGEILMTAMIEICKNKNIKKLSLHSTLNAKKFYSKNGFIEDGDVTTVPVNGVNVRCWPMKKIVD